MRLVDFVSLMDPEVTPEKTKLHLATSNGEEDPLDVYRAGGFDEWQRRQTRRNFERPFIIALIALAGAHRWLYSGVYASEGCDWDDNRRIFYYRLQERHLCSEFNGRLVAKFARPGRQSYLNADSWADQLQVNEILPERVSVVPFPGFKAVDLARIELDALVMHGTEAWKTALSSVAGVYLISDHTSGKLYVGSATGEGGIWQRWCQYSATGHGGNVELMPLVQNEGANGFRFSILEIADLHASAGDILQRESHWKKVLLSRTPRGLNSN